MSENLFEVFGVTVTVTGVHVFATVVTALLFMTLWLVDRKKRTGKPIFAGQVMNGIGFGLLPGLAVWKALRDIGVGPGAEIPEPLPLVDWLSKDGFFRPEHIALQPTSSDYEIHCRVELTEMLGDNTNIYITAGEDQAILKVDSHDTPETDIDYTFYVPLESVYLFDAATEKRIHV